MNNQMDLKYQKKLEIRKKLIIFLDIIDNLDIVLREILPQSSCLIDTWSHPRIEYTRLENGKGKTRHSISINLENLPVGDDPWTDYFSQELHKRVWAFNDRIMGLIGVVRRDGNQTMEEYIEIFLSGGWRPTPFFFIGNKQWVELSAEIEVGVLPQTYVVHLSPTLEPYYMFCELMRMHKSRRLTIKLIESITI